MNTTAHGVRAALALTAVLLAAGPVAGASAHASAMVTARRPGPAACGRCRSARV
jgi:hypothetical protein